MSRIKNAFHDVISGYCTECGSRCGCGGEWGMEPPESAHVRDASSDSDTHPKDGDVKQAPLVSGAGPQDIAQNTSGPSQ